MVNCTNVATSPDWPKTMLQYHLLSSPQREKLARFFTQVWPPLPQTYWYPRLLDSWLGMPNEYEIDLDTRRRRFGYFIGLHGYGYFSERNVPLNNSYIISSRWRVLNRLTKLMLKPMMIAKRLILRMKMNMKVKVTRLEMRLGLTVGISLAPFLICFVGWNASGSLSRR